MKYIFSAIITSFLLCSYYDIGDTILTNHQNTGFDVCYGDYPYEQLELAHFNGKVSVFGLSAAW